MAWDLIYALLDTTIVILLGMRFHDRLKFKAWFSAGVVLFAAVIYVHLAILRWGLLFSTEVVNILNDPVMVLSRTVPLILLLWLSRDGREWFDQCGGRRRWSRGRKQ